MKLSIFCGKKIHVVYNTGSTFFILFGRLFLLMTISSVGTSCSKKYMTTFIAQNYDISFFFKSKCLFIYIYII